jgi:hypothetical protein
MCPNRLFKLRHYLCDNAESDSIPTLFREVSDVGLGYTLLLHANDALTAANVRFAGSGRNMGQTNSCKFLQLNEQLGFRLAFQENSGSSRPG